MTTATVPDPLRAFDRSVFAATIHRKTLGFFDAYAVSIDAHEQLHRFLAFARSYVGSGKAFRALAISVGNYVAGGDPVGKSAVALDLGVAIELYQSSALVHDDLIDNADTRRNIPSVHKQAEAALGISSAMPVAVLIGDLLLSMNHLATTHAVKSLPTADQLRLSDYMARITAEVSWGQYLDVITETRPLTDPDSLRRYVYDVIALKSGHYSVMRPLVLGALMNDPEPQFIETLQKIGRSWGVAFQMRDDVLGAFGDEALTGKPTGSDIREGKRTILLTMALSAANEDDRLFLEQTLGSANASEQDLTRVQQIIKDTGAFDAHEQAISKLVDEGNALVGQLGVDSDREAALRLLGKLLTDRKA
ncbi:MAG: polyprenyl synthetase family protein [Actinomycetaceae bacterium]|nr:polyprenyl synthetase family protein [Actinomycetaceae bacterium]